MRDAAADTRAVAGPFSRSLLFAAVALALSAPLAAQERGQRGEPADPDQAAVLDAIAVTATRKVEDAKEVPIAVSAISADRLDIAGSGGEDIRFLASRLPSLNIESSFGRAFPRFYVRGLGNTDFDLNASQPVSLIYDEVVLENPILKGFPAFDLDQVELLRGPQGTLFGRNTPAGVVKFNSALPEEVFGGYAQLAFGRFDSVNLEGAVGGPVGEDWRTRFSFLSQSRGDWVDNAGPGPNRDLEGYDEQAARLQFHYVGGDRLDALFNVHARRLDGTARLFRANILVPGSNQLVPDFRRDRVFFDGRNEQDLDALGAIAKLRWEFDGVSLHSVTGYETVEVFSRGDIDGGFGAVFAPPFGPGFIPFPAESGDGLPSHHQFTQELRLESVNEGPLNWQAGLFWFSENLRIDSFNYDTLAGDVVNGFATQRQENEAWAAFGSVDYQLNDAFTLRGGLRFTRDRKDFTAERTLSPLAFLGVGPVGPISVSPDDSDLSWDLSGTWRMNEDVNLYGRIAKGFRAPSIQGRLLFGDVVSVAESETVLSYELGMKADLFERRARVNAAVYAYTIDDQQLTAVGGGVNFNTLINADETEGYGFELDVEAYVSDQLLMTAGVSYNHTEINDRSLAVQPCGGGCTVLDPAGSVDGTVSIDGNPLPQAPEWIYNFTARYGIPVGDTGELFVFTDWAYRSKVNFFLYESAEFTGDPLLEGGLRLGYRWNYGLYELALYGRNILDEQEAVGGIDFNNLTGFVNEPRLVGVEFSVWF
jgi:iron complex outermembrane receptor protein